MSKRTFKYSESSLTDLEDAVKNTSADVGRLISDARTKTEAHIAGWSEKSDSRQAQLSFDERLKARTNALTDALDEAAKALYDINELGHQAEVRNVAVLN